LRTRSASRTFAGSFCRKSAAGAIVGFVGDGINEFGTLSRATNAVLWQNITWPALRGGLIVLRAVTRTPS
jgi:cation transport ATPase